MKKIKHKHGYYKHIRQGLDRSLLVQEMGAKRAHKIQKFVKAICFSENATFEGFIGNNMVNLRFWGLCEGKNILDDGFYGHMYLFDVNIDAHIIRINDSYGIDISFADWFGGDFEDTEHFIVSGDIWSSYNNPIVPLEERVPAESLKKSEIVATLGLFRNHFVPEEYNCFIRFDKENDMVVKMEINELTLTVTESGVELGPIPVIKEDGEADVVPVFVACEPWSMNEEELIQAFANAFALASAMQEMISAE